MPPPRRTAPAVLGTLVAAALTGAVGAGAAGAQGGAIAVDDPGLSRQWALALIGAPDAWSVATGEGVTIAIVDSGIDMGHPDLADKVDGIVDCVGHDDVDGGCVAGSGVDDAGHGTHVAGIAAASTDNAQGVAGVAPRARLLSVRVLANRCPTEGDSCEAEGTEDDVAEGIRWAADHGADVINLSLGSVTQAVVGPGQVFTDALEHAWDRGAIPVLVAGNDLLLPGSVVDVPAVVVAATDADDAQATYSSGVGNVRWAVAAPGGEADSAESCASPEPQGILSTYFRPATGTAPATSGYACVSGTSMAAPHVTGALAVLRSAGFEQDEAVERLLATATDLGPPGRDNAFGSGRIDLAAALEGVAPTGQPVRATDSGTSTSTDIETTTTTAAPAATPTTASAAPPEVSPPVTSPPAPAVGVVTDPAPPTTAPAADEEAIGVAGRGPDDDLPAVPLSLAVLALVAVGTGHAWRYLARSGLARRTPL